MNVIITGAGGFLGKNLIKRCVEQEKIGVIAVTRQKDILLQRYKEYGNCIDILATNELDKIQWKNVDAILNCAFPRNDDGVQMADGLDFITKIITKAVHGGIKAVINISSQSVYSQKRTEAATEATQLNLETKYAVGKYAIELFINSICKNIFHTNLRMASLIGVGFDQRITNKLVDQIVKGNNLNIIGGNQVFGFMDVRDAVDGIIKVLNSNMENWKEIYNFGTNEQHALSEIAEMVSTIGEKYMDKKITVDYQDSTEWKNSSMRCDLFFKDFSWHPRFMLSDTIEEIFESRQSA